MARRLVLWRHGRTAWNADDRFMGHTDVPLDATGEAQAMRAAAVLAAVRPDALVTSDLSRALSAAAALGRLAGLVPVPDAGLRERYGGSLEGLRNCEIDDLLARTGKHLEDFGVEPDAEVAERVAASAVRVTAGLADGGAAVLVSHGAAIRLCIVRLLGLPAGLWPCVVSPANGNWSVLAEDGGVWRLVRHDVAA
ncbi:histidine phosphatase family protein [Microbispora hainanensis]|uniref:histidine phosphatase family protein n=1 Tax=Microbispora hainanensis TaxID=568844 RepID=UPI0033EB5C8E